MAVTVKFVATPAATAAGNPLTASDWAAAGWTTIPDWVPAMVAVAVWATFTYWVPAVLSVTEKVCLPSSAATKV